MADWVAVVVAVFSLLLGIINSIWSKLLAKKQEELNNKQLKISQGQMELEMANQLSAAKKYIDSWETMCFEFMDSNEKKKAVTQKGEFVKEELLNCYEGMCQIYLDDKTDKERFEKSYRREIVNLFGKHSICRVKLDGDSSPYKAIKKVYNIWENKE